MSGPTVTYVPDAKDGRCIVVLIGDRATHLRVLDAQLLHVRLGQALKQTVTPAVPPGRINERQRRHLFALVRDRQVTAREDRLGLLSKILDRPVGSMNDLTYDEAEDCITILQRDQGGAS